MPRLPHLLDIQHTLQQTEMTLRAAKISLTQPTNPEEKRQITLAIESIEMARFRLEQLTMEYR